jgi:NTE family protein
MTEFNQDTLNLQNFFQHIPLFRSLSESPAEMEELLHSSRMLTVRRGEYLFRRGDLSDRIYIVHSGEIGIYRGDTLVALQRRGSICGEVSLLSGSGHSSSAKAMFDSSVVVIPGSSFVRLIESVPSVGRELIRILSERFRGALDAPAGLQPGRICSVQYPEHEERSGRLVYSLARAVLEEGHSAVILTLNERSPLIFEKDRNLIEQLQRPKSTRSSDLPVILNLEPLLAGDETNQLRLTLHDLISGLRRTFDLILVDLACRPSAAVQVVLDDSDERLIFYRKDRPVRSSGRVICEKNIDGRERPGELPVFQGLNTDPAVNPAMRRLARQLLQKMRGLCLGGGGARALAHAGCIEVFEEHGLEFDAVSGCSMGAVIGALYALQLPAKEIRRMIGRYLYHSDVILDKSLPFVSFFRGRRMSALLSSVFRGIRIEEMPLPFFCNAVDLKSGQMVMFDSGWLDFALRCTVSLPGIFPPVEWKGRTLVDGSVINNLPGEILRQNGMSHVVGINVSPVADPLSARTGVNRREGLKGVYRFVNLPPILKIVTRSISVANRELLKFRLNDFDFLLNPEVSSFDLFDFHRQSEILQAGYDEAIRQLDGLHRALYNPAAE